MGQYDTLAETASDGGPWTVESLLHELRTHNSVHPHHGIQCVCMDSYIQVLRRMFGLTGVRPGPGGWDEFDMTAYLQSPEHELFERTLYILSVVARSESF